MYALRQQYPKGDPMNLIAKLLMNSLYGKFGMSTTHSLIEMFDTTKESEMELLKDNLDIYGELI